MKKSEKNKKKRKLKMLLMVLGIFIILIIPGFYNGVCIKKYSIQTDKIKNTIRMALVSDLHSCKYGE